MVLECLIIALVVALGVCAGILSAQLVVWKFTTSEAGVKALCKFSRSVMVESYEQLKIDELLNKINNEIGD